MPLPKSVLSGGLASEYGTYAWIDGATTHLSTVGSSYAGVFTPKSAYPHPLTKEIHNEQNPVTAINNLNYGGSI